MTDRQHPPPRAGSHGSATTYTSHDPEPVGEPEEKKPKFPVNVVQISASAGAAVTSAVAASYFGVGGTLAGAAFGSVVSSVAGAFYTESLSKAHKVVATTTAVVVQRYPGDVPQADSIRRMNGPAGVPVADSLNRVGGEDQRHTEVEHVEVPIVDDTQVMSRHDDGTRVMPPVTGVSGASSHQPAAHTSQVYGTQATRRSAQRRAEAEQSWWKKPGFVMAGISMAGFLIALAFILGTETAIGRPISGGESGNTLTKLSQTTSNDTGDDDEEEEGTTTPTESATPSESATSTETATPTATDSETVAPSQSAAPDATTTTDPSSPETTPDTGADQVQPSDQSQNSDGLTDGDTTGEGGVDDQVQEQVNP